MAKLVKGAKVAGWTTRLLGCRFLLDFHIFLEISSASISRRTAAAPAHKVWASTTPSKQQLNPSLTQVPGLQQPEGGAEEVRPGLREHARELLNRDKKKDELDLSFEVE